MNNKIIAAGVVVALCAVALIGVGYAYTATFENGNNSVTSNANYVVITNTSLTKEQISLTISESELTIPYNTTTSVDVSGASPVYTYTYKPDVVGNDIWTQKSETTDYTKTVSINDKVTLNVDTKKAGTPSGQFKLTIDTVTINPSSFSPSISNGIKSIDITMKKLGDTVASDGSASFTGSSDSLVELVIEFEMLITVDSTYSTTSTDNLNGIPPIISDKKFSITYEIEPVA